MKSESLQATAPGAGTSPSTETSVTVVLGMHRSGTSALTGLLARMGLEAGDKLLAPTRHNPEGYFEDTDVLAFDEKLLGLLDTGWEYPLDPARLAAALAEGKLDGALAEGEALLADRLSRYPRWLVKEPRLCELLPAWQVLFRRRGARGRYLWIIRQPENVAASLAARAEFSPDHADQLWLAYNLAILQALQGEEAYLVHYDTLIAEPRRVAAEIADYLQLSLPEAELESLVGSALKSDLRRNRSEAEPAQPLYHQLLALQPGRIGPEQLAQLWSQWQGHWRALQPAWDWAIRLDRKTRRQAGELARLNEECAARLQEADACRRNEAQARRAEAAALNAEAQARHGEAQARHAEAAARQAEAEARRGEAEARRAEADMHGAVVNLQRQVSDLQSVVDAMQSSHSWRLTAPLRAVMGWFKAPPKA